MVDKIQYFLTHTLLLFKGNVISDFKKMVIGLGGEVNASQVVLSSSSTDVKLITKGPNKNTEGKRCTMVPVGSLSKVVYPVVYLIIACFCRDVDLHCIQCLELTSQIHLMMIGQSVSK